MSDLSYPFAGVPEPEALLEVSAGVYWLRLPLPFALDHINVWLLDDGDGWTLIDTGISAEATRKVWECLFNSQFRQKKIRRIIITHHHPDHFGLAKWLSDRFSTGIHATAETYTFSEYLLSADVPDRHGPIPDFYRAHGIDNTSDFANFVTGQSYREIVSGLPDKMDIIKEEDSLTIAGKSWRAIIGYGHAAGHLSLYCEESGLLISGDQVLPEITSNVSLHAGEADTDPLQEYLASFEVFRTLPESTLVLPSHGRVFRGLHQRITVIEKHHQDKLAKVFSYCDEPRLATEVADFLFPRRLDNLNQILAFGETLAHLKHLENQGRIKCSMNDGRYYFQQ